MRVSSLNLEEPVNDGIIKDMIAAFAAMTGGKRGAIRGGTHQCTTQHSLSSL